RPSMMRGNIAPVVQQTQIGQTRLVGWVGGGQVEGKAESLEILLQVLKGRVSMVELPVCAEQIPDQRLKRCSRPEHDNLRTLAVEVAAEPLEVRGQQEHVSAQILLNQIGS